MTLSTAALLIIGLLAACGDKDDTGTGCTPDAYQCTDADVLQQCSAGSTWEDVEDCGSQGLECHADMGHCM